MGLPGQLRKELQNALIDAFPEKSSLEQMLWFELDKNLDVIAGGEGNYRVVVFKLLKIAEAENWVEDLIDAALRENPGNQSLKDVAGNINKVLFGKQLLNREKELEEQCIHLKKKLQETRSEREKEERIRKNLERQFTHKQIKASSLRDFLVGWFYVISLTLFILILLLVVLWLVAR